PMVHQYLATPRRGRKTDITPPAQLLAQFAQAAQHISDVTNISVRKASVVFSATPDALNKLRAQFGAAFIIEPERHLDPLA
ncbi:MAG TPA: hypothetical protein VMG12_25350, partial [Polyangiaceae bacterium]|nr:hypothetical protein [Polyangiaceae bacterium]